jgi:hypothetical protein
VVALAWLEGPVLAVAMERGPRTLIHLHSPQGALPGWPLVMWTARQASCSMAPLLP